MERLQEPLNRQGEITDRIDEILNSATNGVLTPENRTEITNLETEFDTNTAEIENLREDEQRRQRQQNRVQTQRNAAGGRHTQPNNAGEVRFLNHNADDDPNRGFRNPRDFITSVMNHTVGRELDDRLRPLMAAGSDDHQRTSEWFWCRGIPGSEDPDCLATVAKESE